MSSLGVALHRGRAQVMFLDNNTATASHKARTHGPGWRTAHASSIDEKGLLVYPYKATSAPPCAGTTGILELSLIIHRDHGNRLRTTRGPGVQSKQRAVAALALAAFGAGSASIGWTRCKYLQYLTISCNAHQCPGITLHAELQVGKEHAEVSNSSMSVVQDANPCKP